MSKFAKFGVSDIGTSKCHIVNPNTGEPYLDKAGKQSYIEVAHFNGPDGLKWNVANERENSRRPPLPDRTRDETNNIVKLAALTRAWYLVDEQGDEITLDDKPFPCRADNALTLYAEERWLYLQVFVHSTVYANFRQPPSNN